jgi:hypothetical protein
MAFPPHPRLPGEFNVLLMREPAFRVLLSLDTDVIHVYAMSD